MNITNTNQNGYTNESTTVVESKSTTQGEIKYDDDQTPSQACVEDTLADPYGHLKYFKKRLHFIKNNQKDLLKEYKKHKQNMLLWDQIHARILFKLDVEINSIKKEFFDLKAKIDKLEGKQ